MAQELGEEAATLGMQRLQLEAPPLVHLCLSEEALALGRDGNDATRALASLQCSRVDGKVHESFDQCVRTWLSFARSLSLCALFCSRRLPSEGLVQALFHRAARAVAQQHLDSRARRGGEELAVQGRREGLGDVHCADRHNALESRRHIIPRLAHLGRGAVATFGEKLHEPCILAAQHKLLKVVGAKLNEARLRGRQLALDSVLLLNAHVGQGEGSEFVAVKVVVAERHSLPP